MLPPTQHLRVVHAVEDLLIALGEDPHRPGIKDTPRRVAEMYSDVLDGAYTDLPEPTMFAGESYKGMVMQHHIPFYAFCEHHLLPFIGHFGIGYVPAGDRVIGLSKLVRIFRHGTKRITIQERLTTQAVEQLTKLIQPLGAICYVKAEHMCMTLRGVKSQGSKTTTIEFNGIFDDDRELRDQFIQEASK